MGGMQPILIPSTPYIHVFTKTPLIFAVATVQSPLLPPPSQAPTPVIPAKARARIQRLQCHHPKHTPPIPPPSRTPSHHPDRPSPCHPERSLVIPTFFLCHPQRLPPVIPNGVRNQKSPHTTNPNPNRHTIHPYHPHTPPTANLLPPFAASRFLSFVVSLSNHPPYVLRTF